MLFYDKGFGFEGDNIISQHDNEIKSLIHSQLNENDIFVDTTWITLDHELLKLIDISKKESKRFVCYSGPDWNNVYGPPREKHTFADVWTELNECEVIHIGNNLGKYYFSFWVDFVHKHINKYQSYDTFNLQTPLKTFMCLNRKPHRPRIDIIREFLRHDLMQYGHVSLGGENVLVEQPILLPTDIQSSEGDKAVKGDVGITNDINSLGHIDNWNSHFLNVVTETTVYTDVFLTEKTLKPIIGKRPFIILGDKNIYKLLQDWGFDTFDDLFGKGYNEANYEQRIEWIVSNIQDLNKESNLEQLLLDLKPRLEHNYQQFFKVASSNRQKITNLFN